MKFTTALVTILLGTLAASPTPLLAGDWPMWRRDAARSASSDESLPQRLNLQWVRELPPLEVAWPDQPMMWFDRQYEPIVVDGRVIVGSSQTDSLTAYDSRSGKRLWEFRAEGPIRFAPAGFNHAVYVVADDGYLYCLEAADGRLRWKHRGGPSDRKVLGNDRLISMWPARGGPVVADGVVHYAAGIWPFMGIFLHALDAETGAVRWTNDGDGSRFTMQPHSTPSFAGVAPQGALAIEGDRLIVPGGRSTPACYDRHTGRLLHYELAKNNKRGGGSDVAVGSQLIFNGGYTFTANEGDSVEDLKFVPLPVLHDEHVYLPLYDGIKALALHAERFKFVEGKDRKGETIKVRKLNYDSLWTTKLVQPADLIRAGEQLLAAVENRVVSLDLSSKEESPRVVPLVEVEGTIARLIVADERLFVVTLEGKLYGFGADETAAVVHRGELTAPKIDPAVSARAEQLLDAIDAPEGYVVVWGVGDGGLVHALLRSGSVNVIAIDPDLERANLLRASLVDAGLYGSRAAVLVGTPTTLELPPYFASAMICDDPRAAGIAWDDKSIPRLFASLRPYGGQAVFQLDDTAHRQLASAIEQASLAGSNLARDNARRSILSRPGPLPGSADWTHEHADAANTRNSRDQLVQLPLGILWFGGPSHNAILPRHGHGPQPQVVEGRVILEGPDVLRATDAYTGRLLWERDLPDVGALYNNTAHHAGANGTGTNFISLPDGIYAIYTPGCLRLDPRTGETLHSFQLPTLSGEKEPPRWNSLNVVDGYLVACIDLPESLADPRKRSYEDVVASKRIYVLDRHDGRVLWTVDAQFQFRNNTICLGGGRLYCVDLLSQAEIDSWKRRGQQPKDNSKLYAFDLATGSVVWSTEHEVFGTWLSYSAEFDVLVESGRPGRDVLKDEPKGMRAYRGASGEVLWNASHSGPAILQGRKIFGEKQGCDLLTGELLQREDPLTGEQVAWVWKRNYGCNTPQACENLLLFRSGAAGYCDLTNDGGTGNFGGFRSSCTNNLIAAGGILNVPEYTRTCTCDYQNQTSLALVHMPDVEIWTEFPLSGNEEVRHVAINLGAPGFRRAADGRLWLNDFSGLKIVSDGDGAYCRHTSNVLGDGDLNWVAASGYRGIRRLELDPQRKQAGEFTVRLHFCEPDHDQPGQRVFDVKLQGRTVLEGFDPTTAAGGSLRPIVEEIRGIRLPGKTPLIVELIPRSNGSRGWLDGPILNGIELILDPAAP